jgi:hypothetical protein
MTVTLRSARPAVLLVGPTTLAPAEWSSAQLAGRLQRARQRLTGGMPSGIAGNFHVDVTAADGWLAGTVVPEVHVQLRPTVNGLLVPASQTPSTPLDQIQVFITASELGMACGARFIREQLARVELETVLAFAAGLLRRRNTPGSEHAQLDLDVADEWFLEPTRTRVRNLLIYGENRALVAPQLIFLLVKLACLFSPDRLLPRVPTGDLVGTLLALGDMESIGELNDGSSHGPMVRHLVANHAFHASANEASRMGRFVRLWRQLPVELAGHPRVVDLPQAYWDATGIELEELMWVGAALWSSVCQGATRVGEDWFEQLPLDRQRRDAVLAMIALDAPGLRAAVRDEVGSLGLEWAIGTFERFPLVRLSDGAVGILDPALLVRRCFGWHQLFDIRHGWEQGSREQRKRLKLVDGCVRHLSEVYALEVLASIAALDRSCGELIGETQLRAAFSRGGQKLADAVMPVAGGWLVAEVTTSQLTRHTVAGINEQKLVADLDKLVAKAGQLDATIHQLRTDASRLGAHRGRRFYPVLILPEGFPANFLSLHLLREKVEAAGLLSGADVAPLEVVDVVELEMVEQLTERGHRLESLLDGKTSSGWSNRSLRDFLLLGTLLNPTRPSRLNRLWPLAFPSISQLGGTLHAA